MLRLLIITAVTACVLHCTQADAQLFGRRHHSSRGAKLQRYESHRQTANTERTYRPYNPSSGLNISIGIGGYPRYYSGFGGYGYLDPYRFDGYGYDPYRYGSFEAPDLLKDPYFRERYRYDSKFPGRYRAPVMPRTSLPVEIDDLYGFRTTDKDYRSGSSVLMDTEPAFKTLRQATEQLAAGLAVSEYGEAWLEYLGPRELPLLIAREKNSELQVLMSHYDGVVENPKLQYITATRGFSETRGLLRRYLGVPASGMDSQVIRISPTTAEPVESGPRDKPETLPVPQPANDEMPSLNRANRG